MRKFQRLLPIVVILLVAFLLRTYRLTEIPPGLTHDEANHGREAMGILAGNLALFFPLNYGSEPLYSYTVAGHMLLLGKGPLALRLVNVFFGLLAISATFLWGKIAFDRRLAWFAAAIMALSFWSLASSREALRAGMMPFFTAGAMIFFWLLLQRSRTKAAEAASGAGEESGRPAGKRHTSPSPFLLAAGLTVCLTAILYNYLAARVLWLTFPIFLLYLGLFHRSRLRRVWLPTAISLAATALLVTPMFLYLQRNPQAQTRLQMFGGTLQDLLQGNVAPLLEKAAGALLAFFWPGHGDQFLAYNIPGRPVFEPLSALLFLVGVAVCLWRWRRPKYAFLLTWFIVGIAPSLITGATANTTRNVGALSTTFLLPALGFVTMARIAQNRIGRQGRRVAVIVAGLWLIFAGWNTVRDYFVQWGQSPDVRAAYQHTLVEALSFLEQSESEDPVVISSVRPGAAHNPSIALVTSPQPADRRWVDARRAIVFPRGGAAQLVVLSEAPLHPAFGDWTRQLQTVTLGPDDLDPSFTLYRLERPQRLPGDPEPVPFGGDRAAMMLLGSGWLSDGTRAGETAQLMHVWRVVDPLAVGPLHQAIQATDVVLFTHVLDGSGQILAQEDRSDAPSWDWRAGDVVVQIHEIRVPPETPAGRYRAMVGLYDRQTVQPLPLLETGQPRAEVDPLNVMP